MGQFGYGNSDPVLQTAAAKVFSGPGPPLEAKERPEDTGRAGESQEVSSLVPGLLCAGRYSSRTPGHKTSRHKMSVLNCSFLQLEGREAC